jgi:hypothetical protein
MVLPVNLFKNSLILVWCFYINLHAEISEPLQHYLFRLFLIRSSTTRESLLGASSFYLILFSTVVPTKHDLYQHRHMPQSKDLHRHQHRKDHSAASRRLLSKGDAVHHHHHSDFHRH